MLLNTQPAILIKRFNLNKKQSIELKKCYNAFHNYKFFSLIFDGFNQDDIRDIFIRINSAGATIKRAEVLFANASDVNLRDLMLDTRRGLQFGYSKISIDVLQSVLALAYGARVIGTKGNSAFLNKIKTNGNQKEFPKIWKALNYGYQMAVDFLVNTLHVTKLELLPSQNIYTMLAFFFYLNKSRANPKQIREIKKWFWHTSCGDRYSGGGFNKNISPDIKFFMKLAKNTTAKYVITDKILPLDFLKSGYKNSKSSSATAYFLMLREKKPKYLINGLEMLLDNPSAISNRKDRHHIFPFALLRRNSINPKWINGIVNICYLESDENQSISDKHPRLYLEEYKQKRHFGKVMKSHLIPCDRESPVWKKDVRIAFIDFINVRSKHIINEIEKNAGGKLFEKLDPIKRI